MSEIIYLSNVRLSFPHLIDPQILVNVDGVESKSYNADFLMPADHQGFKDFMARYQELAVEKYKEHAPQAMAAFAADRKVRCYGNETDKINKANFQPYCGYVGNVYITASIKNQLPQIYKDDGLIADPSNTMLCQSLLRKMYGGCYVNAVVKPFLQIQKGGGIRCELVAIQFAKDGEAFGEGAIDTSGLFGAVSTPAPAAPQAMPAAPFPGFAPAAPQAMPAAPFPGFMS